MSLQTIRALVEQGQRDRARAMIEYELHGHASADALAMAAELCDDQETAITYARRALAHDPNHAEAYALLQRLLGDNFHAHTA